MEVVFASVLFVSVGVFLLVMCGMAWVLARAAALGDEIAARAVWPDEDLWGDVEVFDDWPPRIDDDRRTA